MRALVVLAILVAGCGDPERSSCPADMSADGIVESPTEEEIKKACDPFIWMCDDRTFGPYLVKCTYCQCQDGRYGLWSCSRDGQTCGQVVKRFADRVWIGEFKPCF